MFRTDYFLFMNEAENTGLFKTKREKTIDNVVDDFVRAYHKGVNINDYDIQNEIFEENHIDPLPEELSYIKKRVERSLY